MNTYWRPIMMTDAARPANAVTLGGGWTWFDRVEMIKRGGESEIVSVDHLPAPVLDAFIRPRAAIAGLGMAQPRIMGIVNVTPDSFSDGGQYSDASAAIASGRAMVAQGADILDVGGESTRPGSAEVGVSDEIARIEPVISGLAGVAPISIDTRKSDVARVAVSAGADIINDVSALSFDPELGRVAADSDAPVCLMHAQGAPETMQDNPQYEDVLLDVYDGLDAAISRAVKAGINRDRIIVDPGIGFGKTFQHNLTLLRRISIFHGFGLPVLLGASRKRFIGSITKEDDAGQRIAGSVAVAQMAVQQGVQIVRVHDIKETREALQMVHAILVQ